MLALLTTLAFADCMSGSLTVSPDVGTAVPTRGELVVHAYGTERAQLADLTEADVALRTSDGTVVDVEFVAQHRGSFSDAQLVLRPTADLPQGKVTLLVRGESPTVWHDDAHRPIRWTVNLPPPTVPAWASAPEVTDNERILMGCGPSIWATVRTDVDAPWVDVTLAARGAEPVTGRVAVKDGAIRIGHGMCSGLFELERGTSYTAELTAVAADGSRAKAPSPVRFVAQ